MLIPSLSHTMAKVKRMDKNLNITIAYILTLFTPKIILPTQYATEKIGPYQMSIFLSIFFLNTLH